MAGGGIFPALGASCSVVRVAPAGRRAVRNTGTTPLTMLRIQYQAAEPGSVNPSDGTILNEPVKW